MTLPILPYFPAGAFDLTEPLTGLPVDRDTRRAHLLAACRKPIGSVPGVGILSGRWDQGTIVGAFRGGRGTFRAD
jgi:hypothetical protein